MAQIDEHRSVSNVVAGGTGPLLVVALLHRYGHYFTRDGAVCLDFRSELLPELLRFSIRKLVNPYQFGNTLSRFPRVVRGSRRLLFLSIAYCGSVKRLVAH
jgi:hypothetical protein